MSQIILPHRETIFRYLYAMLLGLGLLFAGPELVGPAPATASYGCSDWLNPKCSAPHPDAVRCPLCCPYPCPTGDSQSQGDWSSAQSDVRQATRLIGSADAVGSPPEYPRSNVSADDIRSASIAVSRITLNRSLGNDGSRVSFPAIDTGILYVPEMHLDEESLPDTRVDLDQVDVDRMQDLETYRGQVQEDLHLENQGEVQEEYDNQRRRLTQIQRNTLNTLSASLKARHDMKKYAEGNDVLVRMVEDAQDLADEIRVNSFLRQQVIRELVRYSTMQEVEAQSQASSAIASQSPHVMKEPPPAGREGVQPAAPTQDEELQAEIAIAVDLLHATAAALVSDYNDLASYRHVEAMYPDLLKVVDEHEKMKAEMWTIETAIRRALSQIGRGNERDWQTLRTQLLERDKTDFTDANLRWTRARQAAAAVSGPYDAAYRSQNSNASSTPRGTSMAIQNRNAGDPGLAYRIDIKYNPCGLTMPREGCQDVYYPHFYVATQFYLEAHKRANYYADLRRGFASQGDMTSAELWAELVANHRAACIMGPMSATNTNIARHPHYFDVKPTCSPRKWSNAAPAGLAGRTISSEYLGGTDRAIWSSRTLLDQRRDDLQQEDEVVAAAYALLEIAETIAREMGADDLVTALSSQGHHRHAQKAGTAIDTADLVIQLAPLIIQMIADDEHDQILIEFRR